MTIPALIHAHGRTLTIRKTSTGSYVLRVEGSTRARFGNTAQAREDIAHFEATGALPPPCWTGTHFRVS